MDISPRESGIYAQCECGSRQFVPSASVKKHKLLYCPCGAISEIPLTVINGIQKRVLGAYLRKQPCQAELDFR